MKVEEIKLVSVEEKTLTGFKCDACGKVHEGHVYPSDWYHFLIINSWSTADDDESFGDVCSAECYLVEVEKGIKNDNQVSGMQKNFAKKIVALLNSKYL